MFYVKFCSADALIVSAPHLYIIYYFSYKKNDYCKGINILKYANGKEEKVVKRKNYASTYTKRHFVAVSGAAKWRYFVASLYR